MKFASSAQVAPVAAPAKNHIYAIDLLRFLAAMAVVWVHWCFTPPYQIMTIDAAKYGMFGVQLFFLISGFVILMSAQGQAFRAFVVARLVRLYPAFWICCTISALFCFGDPLVGWPEYFANMTMIPNPFYTQLINGAYWSLLIEAKFYLLIAILILCGGLQRIEFVMWSWLLASSIASSYLMRKLLMAQYAPFFIGGCACFLLAQRRSWSRWALLCLAFAAGMRETLIEVGLRGGVLDAVASCALVASFFAVILAISQNWLAIPRWRFIGVLGAISYPLYLLHQRIAIEIRWTTESPALLAAAFMWIILLSYTVHRWGEVPLQRWMRKKLSMADGTPAPGAAAEIPAKVGGVTAAASP